MGDPVLRQPVSPGPYVVAAEEQPLFHSDTAAADAWLWFQRRCEEWTDRIGAARTAYSSGFARELRDNLQNVRSRVRDFNEQRPLQLLGTIAAAGFAVGLLVGFRRRG